MAKSRTTRSGAPASEQNTDGAGTPQTEEKKTRKRAAPKEGAAPKEKAAGRKTAPKEKAAAKEKAAPKRTRAKGQADQGGQGPSQEEIARRAHELFQARGGQHGYHNQDWFEAEQQLRSGKGGGSR